MVQVPVRFMTLSGGFVGTDQTVALMSQLAMGPYGARSPKIQASAVKILKAAQVAPKDYTSEMVAIHNWYGTTFAIPGMWSGKKRSTRPST